jgi:hypothetical protein
MDAILVTGSGDRGSARYLDIVVISRERRPQSVRDLRQNRRPRAHPTASSARSQPPPARISCACSRTLRSRPRRSAGRPRLSLTESARMAVGPDLELGRRSPSCAIHQDAPRMRRGVRCRLRYGPAGRWRSPQRVRDRHGARDPCRQGTRPGRSCTRSPRSLSGTLPRATGIDLDGIYTNTNSHSASHSGSTANAVVTGGRHEYRI